MGKSKSTKNIGTELVVRLIGAVVIAAMFYFILAPTAIHSIYSTGAGAIFKKTPECKEWHDKFIKAMEQKDNTSKIIEEAKHEGCTK